MAIYQAGKLSDRINKYDEAADQNLLYRFNCRSADSNFFWSLRAGAGRPDAQRPGVIEDDLIRSIANSVPPPVATFLLTSETSAEAIIAHHHRTLTNTIQIVDALPDGTYQDLRHALPHVKFVQVIHVLNEQSIDEALRVSAHADALLLDSGNPNLAVKELEIGRAHI